MKYLPNKKTALIITAITLSITLFAGWRVYLLFAKYPHTSISDDKSQVELLIPRGTTFNGIVKILKDQELIEKPLFFRIYTLLSKGDISVQKGSYIFKRNFTPAQILKTLLKGPVVLLVSVTIPEGKNILQIAEILSNAKVAKKEDFIKKMRDPAFIKELSLPGKTLEGYLFPETYKFRKNAGAEKVLRILVKQHKKIWGMLKHKNLQKFRRLKVKFGFNSHDIITMASLVEKETGVKKERPLISGVFLNRLSFKDFKPKYLQTDPTIIYGCTVPIIKSEACKKFKGRIRRIHLRDKDNPYNTYTVLKLPPGPICSPGKAALNAVFNPTPSKYLYFVAKTPGGEHYFSKTVKEHNGAVRKYILNK
jgi:peptidoglycan lytic transglycosylase G